MLIVPRPARLIASVVGVLATWIAGAPAQVFGPAQSYPLPGTPAGLAVGDLDLDGALDVVVALPALDRVALLYGLPGGGFAAPTTHATAGHPVDVALADLDGDGRLDIVVACRDSLGFTLLLGKPTGSQFTAGETWASGFGGVGIEPNAITVADVDRDGDPDVIVGHRAGAFVGLRLTGDNGLPGALVEYHVGGAVQNLVAGSLDGDPYPEVVVAADTGGTKILRNQAGAGFVVEFGPATFGGFTAWVDLGDGDGDGDLDLLWAEDDGIDVCVELAPNDGSGTFFTSQVVHVTFSSTSIRATAFGSLDLDGDPDIVSTGPTGPGPNESIEVAFGSTGLAVDIQCPLTSPGTLAAFVLADLDGDGRDEFLGADVVNRALDVAPNGGCGAAPTIAAVDPAVAPALAQAPTQVTLSGCTLDGVTAVTVGGLPAAPQPTSCGDQLGFDLPLGLPLGPASIVVDAPGGTGVATIEIVAPAEPALVIAPTGQFSIAGGADLVVGAAPGDLVLVIASINNLPSVLPGLVELDLGGAFSFIELFATVTIPPGQGSLSLPVPTAGMPLGGNFYLQTAVVTAGAPSLPLPTSPLVTGIVVP